MKRTITTPSFKQSRAWFFDSRTWKMTLCIAWALLFHGIIFSQEAAKAPFNLKVAGLTRPMDLVDVAPMLQWKLSSATQQKVFQIVLGTSENILTSSANRIFESGWIESGEPRFEYVVADNNSPQRLSRLRQPYYWSVRVCDTKGNISAWAPVEQFALRPPMPPRWGLGLVLSAWTKYATSEQMRFHAEQARKTGIPADAVCIDLNWGDHLGLTGGWAPGYADQPELEKWLEKNGFKFIIINHLSYSKDSTDAVVKEMFDRGFINMNTGVEVNLHNREDASRFHKGGKRYAPDFSNPQAREFIKQKILKPYIVNSGIDGWWNDLPDDYGDWGSAVTTDADLYLKIMYESLAENTYSGNGRPFMISQPNSRIYPTFSPGIPRGYWRGMLTHVVTHVRASEYDMANVIHAVTNMISPPNTEYFARSSAFGLMFPMVWNHNARFPWLWIEDLQPIYAKYAQLHYRLIPYYYTMFYRNWERGERVLQSMDIAFPGAKWPAEMNKAVCQYNRDILGKKRLDPEFYKGLQQYPDSIRVIDTQFLLGDNMLIVPVYPEVLPEEKVDRALYEAESKKPIAGIVTKRKFWLPAGKWADFWTAAVHEGPKVMEVDCPIDYMPVFVRMGSIIPMQPDMDYVNQKPVDPLTFEIYPEGQCKYVLYEDDGVTQDYRKGINAQTEISCIEDKSGVSITLQKPAGPYASKIIRHSYVLKVLMAKPTRAKIGNKELPWSYDEKAGKAIIKLSAGDLPARVVITR